MSICAQTRRDSLILSGQHEVVIPACSSLPECPPDALLLSVVDVVWLPSPVPFLARTPARSFPATPLDGKEETVTWRDPFSGTGAQKWRSMNERGHMALSASIRDSASFCFFFLFFFSFYLLGFVVSFLIQFLLVLHSTNQLTLFLLCC